jgi:hypothetical protein
MKGMRRISRGSGFGGVLRYVAQGKGREVGHGRLLGGTMVGGNENALSVEFNVIAACRPDIKKPVWHSSLRMPKNEDVTDESWMVITYRYMKKMGWDIEKTQFCVWKHADEHIHIIANRILCDGTIFYGRNENLRSTQVIHELEKEFCLSVTKGVELTKTGVIAMPAKSLPKKGEIEKSIRTGRKPERLVFQEVIDHVMSTPQTVTSFVEALEASNISVHANIATTGRMNGFSFGYCGLRFTGSQLGAKYKWESLIKVLAYEKTRDDSELARRRGTSSHNANDDRTSAPDWEVTNPDSTVSCGNRTTGSSTTPNIARDKKTRQSTGPNRKAFNVAEKQVSEAVIVLEKMALPMIEADITARREAWHQQHQALGAHRYSLTLAPQRKSAQKEKLGDVVSGTRASTDVLHAAEDISKMIPSLRASNLQGIDVYITPVDRHWHYLTIDNMTSQSIERMCSNGYRPALVQSSSACRLQAVLKINRTNNDYEDLAVDLLRRKLNKLYGKIHLPVGCKIPIAGFLSESANKRSSITRIVEAIGTVCSVGMKAISLARQMIVERRRLRAIAKRRAERISCIKNPSFHAEAGPMCAYQKIAHRIYDVCEGNWNLIDSEAVRELHELGFDFSDIQQALVGGSPQVETSHRDYPDNILRIIKKYAVGKCREKDNFQKEPASKKDGAPS